MFQFTGLAFLKKEYIDFIDMGCPIRRFTGQCLFAARHDFSQLITSFFASESLGIHRTPFSTSFSYSLPLNISFVSTCQRTFHPEGWLWRISESNRCLSRLLFGTFDPSYKTMSKISSFVKNSFVENIQLPSR